VTIRAFKWSDAFVEQNLLLLDNSQKPYYILWCIQRWLALVLDLVVTVLAVIMMVLVVKLRSSVSSGYVRLAILNVINFSQSLAWIIRQWTSLETSIGAVSRLKNFTLSTPNENLVDENQPFSDSWPETGAIELKNLAASYTIAGPLVLKGINMSIKSREKIGICGRTGSGKSSLIMTLFHLLEIPSQSSSKQNMVPLFYFLYQLHHFMHPFWLKIQRLRALPPSKSWQLLTFLCFSPCRWRRYHQNTPASRSIAFQRNSPRSIFYKREHPTQFFT
jgi:hypothetical protein